MFKYSESTLSRSSLLRLFQSRGGPVQVIFLGGGGRRGIFWGVGCNLETFAGDVYPVKKNQPETYFHHKIQQPRSSSSYKKRSSSQSWKPVCEYIRQKRKKEKQIFIRIMENLYASTFGTVAVKWMCGVQLCTTAWKLFLRSSSFSTWTWRLPPWIDHKLNIYIINIRCA